MGEVGGAAEVAPVVFVVAECEDFFAFSRETEIPVDDGKDAFFGKHGEKEGRNDVDTGKGEGK